MSVLGISKSELLGREVTILSVRRLRRGAESVYFRRESGVQ
jgi:hypothetical protein